MRILFLSAWCPWPADNGSKLRIYHLLRGLSQRHEVDLLTFCPAALTAEQARVLRAACRDVALVPETPFAGRRLARALGLLSPRPRSLAGNFSAAMAGLVRQRCAARRYDVVVASQLHMAPYALLAGGARKVLEELELAPIYEQYARAARRASRLRHGLTWWKTSRYVGGLLGRFAGVSVASDAERALADRQLPHRRGVARPKIAVIPNGVDVAAHACAFGPPEPDTLIYPGALSYQANFDAVAHFLGAILPLIRRERPAARLLVTGHAAAERIAALPADAGVEFTGYLDDVRPAVARAWAEVVPLREGGGTRLKVLEALALGTPVISTSKGVEGLDLVAGRDVLVADTPAEFAAQTLRLLASADLRARLAAHGQRAAAGYDWSQSVRALELMLELAAGASR